MATSNRTIFQSSPAVVRPATVRRAGETADGQSRQTTVVVTARERAIAAQTKRLEEQQGRQQQQQQQLSQTAIYRGDGNYSSLGGTSEGYRPRGSVTSGGVPPGSTVPNSDGLVGGMPAPSGDAFAAIKLLEQRTAEVDLSAGAQVIFADPNDIDGEGTLQAPRRPNDLLYSLNLGTLYYFRPTGTEAAAWVPVAQQASGNIPPEDPGVLVGGTYYDVVEKKPYFWDGVDWIGVAGTDKVQCILYGASTFLSVANSTAVAIDWADIGLEEQVDSGDFWDASDPQKIYLPSIGLYRLSLSVALEYLTGNNQESDWNVIVRLKNVGGSTAETYRFSRRNNSTNGFANITTETSLNDSLIVKCDTAGQYLDFEADQKNNLSQSLEFGAGEPCSLHIERLA